MPERLDSFVGGMSFKVLNADYGKVSRGRMTIVRESSELYEFDAFKLTGEVGYMGYMLDQLEALCVCDISETYFGSGNRSPHTSHFKTQPLLLLKHSRSRLA
jgi:hypothetical protein